MNLNFGSMVARLLDLPRSRPVLAVPTRRSQHMHIKYMFIVQRCRLMPAAAGWVFAPRTWSLTGYRLGAAIRKVGAAKPAADQIVEDAAPGVAALLTCLDREQTTADQRPELGGTIPPGARTFRRR
jgi:hypothetical protein